MIRVIVMSTYTPWHAYNHFLPKEEQPSPALSLLSFAPTCSTSIRGNQNGSLMVISCVPQMPGTAAPTLWVGIISCCLALDIKCIKYCLTTSVRKQDPVFQFPWVFNSLGSGRSAEKKHGAMQVFSASFNSHIIQCIV